MTKPPNDAVGGKSVAECYTAFIGSPLEGHALQQHDAPALTTHVLDQRRQDGPVAIQVDPFAISLRVVAIREPQFDEADAIVGAGGAWPASHQA